MQAEEAAWTSLIVKYENVEAPWKADVVGRAYGNRGNARSRQGKFELALQDYTVAVDMCPWSVDPVLNRGVLYENTGRLQLAERDYRCVGMGVGVGVGVGVALAGGWAPECVLCSQLRLCRVAAECALRLSFAWLLSVLSGVSRVALECALRCVVGCLLRMAAECALSRGALG